MPTAKWLTETQVRLPSSIFIATITGGWAELDTEPTWIHDPDFYSEARHSNGNQYPLDRATKHPDHSRPGHLGRKARGIRARNVLRKVLKLYENEDGKPIVSPELEFYLTK